jgi:hypothetical protein
MHNAPVFERRPVVCAAILSSQLLCPFLLSPPTPYPLPTTLPYLIQYIPLPVSYKSVSTHLTVNKFRGEIRERTRFSRLPSAPHSQVTTFVTECWLAAGESGRKQVPRQCSLVRVQLK